MNRNNSASKKLRGLGPNLVASGLILFLNAASGVLLARAFAPAERGALAAAILWPTIVDMLGALGQPEAVTFFIARRRATAGTVVGSALLIAVVRVIAIVGITAALLPLVLNRYGDGVLAAGYLYLAVIPGQAYNLVSVAALNGQQRYRAVATLRVLIMALSTVALLVLFVADAVTINRVVLTYVGAQAVFFAAVQCAGAPCRLRDLRISRTVTRGLLSYGSKAYIGTISMQTNQRADQPVIALALSARDLGLYVVAVNLTAVTAFVGYTAGYFALPAIGGEDDAKAVRGSARQLISFTIMASAIITVPMLIAAPDVLRFFFGSAYAGVSGVARVLFVAAMALGTARVMEGVLRAIDRPWDASVAEIIALSVTFFGLAVFLPIFGLMGAALASVAAYLTSLAWMTRRLASALAVRPAWLLLDGPRNALVGMLRTARSGLRRRAAN